jgi:uncharacterized protein
LQTWSLVQSNLLSPPVLAFVLGAVAVFLKSDLALPEQLYSGLSMYLLLAIGLRGGHELAATPLATVLWPALATLALGALIPLLCYAVLTLTGRFGVADRAALAAHYGSVSAVTFAAALTFLDSRAVPYEGFMAALVALLEVPAIVVALLIARTALGRRAVVCSQNSSGGGATLALGGGLPVTVPDRVPSWRTVLHEVVAGRSVLLLLGGLAVGYLSTSKSADKVAPLFMNLFYGALVLFLLDLGTVAARHLRSAGESAAARNPAAKGVFGVLAAFAVLMPIVNGALGVMAARAAGLGFGGAVVLGVMAASASYIAAPAAIRVALPQANPGYYLTASIGITFPFNLTIGIPLVFEMARLVYS